jgi:hypothetical protein
MSQNRIYRKLPYYVQSALLISEGWLVGKSIYNILENREVKDYDIIVPSRELFQVVCKMLFSIAEQANINSFGGYKVKLPDGTDIDIWCEELDHFLKNSKYIEYIYNMKKNIILKNYNE